MKGIKIYKQNCDPKDAEDRTLPYTSYLVEYKLDGKTCYDLAITGKKVDLLITIGTCIETISSGSHKLKEELILNYGTIQTNRKKARKNDNLF